MIEEVCKYCIYCTWELDAAGDETDYRCKVHQHLVGAYDTCFDWREKEMSSFTITTPEGHESFKKHAGEIYMKKFIELTQVSFEEENYGLNPILLNIKRVLAIRPITKECKISNYTLINPTQITLNEGTKILVTENYDTIKNLLNQLE